VKATYGDIVDDYRTSAEERLRRTAGSETFSGLDVDTQLFFGNTPLREQPGTRALEARQGARGGRRRHGQPQTRGVGAMILDSVSQRAVHDATVPVIIVPPHLERAEEASA
jgi:hypothetical protein